MGGATGGGAPAGVVAVGGAPAGVATGGGAPAGVVAVGGVPGITPGSLRPPGQPRVAQVIAMSKHQGRVSLSPRSSETLSSCASSCASSTSSSEAACCHAPPERSSSGIVTVNAHAPHHPVVHLPPPSNGAPWGWRGSANGSSADVRQLRSAKSLSPASSVCDPAYEPRPPEGHAQGATPHHPAVGPRAASFEWAGSAERGATLERAGSLPQRSANQL